MQLACRPPQSAKGDLADRVKLPVFRCHELAPKLLFVDPGKMVD